MFFFILKKLFFVLNNLHANVGGLSNHCQWFGGCVKPLSVGAEELAWTVFFLTKYTLKVWILLNASSGKWEHIDQVPDLTSLLHQLKF